ncbi:mfs monocarboxylate transporter protein [Purpureocillium lavendulum]|uniref:Mfs monocarboxylate transporter protein n=1 Tax=Purpureocillium lavendulum TaxID=1247861 RepID=A0AB34FVI5_9HYPO|nr:mfs monocarboxylate transporter protein [Purpureocillium lavendulum]
MSRYGDDDGVALRDLTSDGIGHGHQGDSRGAHSIDDTDLHEHASSPPPEPSQARKREARQRALVLVGSALSQLPIWGFAMNYGVFQEFYTSTLGTPALPLTGSPSATGIIGTTSNGVLYLSMPPLFLLLTTRHRSLARRRRASALAGAALCCAAFLLSSAARAVWHLVAAQGVLAALGAALLYSPLTLALGEWYRGRNRAVAYGLILSCKNVVGSACPFLLRALLDRFGFRATMCIWTGVTAVTSVVAIALVPTHPAQLELAREDDDNGRASRRRPPMHFLRHTTFYVYAVAIMLQSSGYGIPQTYLNTYAHDVAHLSQTTATLLLTVFNGPGIVASLFFGYLTDNKRFPLSATSTTAIAGVSSALSALLFWGLTSPQSGSMALLVLFSVTFGFFAGGYSATWGGVVNELEGEAARRNEAIDTGLVYGLLNGARGVGYVGGGLAGLPLLKVGGGALSAASNFGYGTSYGPLIIFTGLSSMFGGLGLLWRGVTKLSRHRMAASPAV